MASSMSILCRDVPIGVCSINVDALLLLILGGVAFGFGALRRRRLYQASVASKLDSWLMIVSVCYCCRVFC